MEYERTMLSFIPQPSSGGQERKTGRPPTSYQPKTIIKNDRVAKVGKTEHISMQIFTYMQINAKLSICPQLRHFLF